MTRIDLEIHDDVISVLNKFKNINDSGIELEIPEGSVLFDNVINLKLLEKEAEKLGKSLHFRTLDDAGINMIASIKDGESYEPTLQEETSIAENTTYLVDSAPPETKKFSFKLPSFGSFNLAGIVPGRGIKVPLAILLVVGLLGAGGYTFAAKAPKAQIKIIVNSQPLTRSLSVKVKKDATSDAEQKILRGFNVEAITTETATIETTGEKMVGEKATGKITIINKTDTAKTIKKGTEIEYDDKELKYTLKEDVTIPAQVIADPLDPATVKWGEAEGTVTASDIGDTYNISKGKALDVNGYKNTEFVAKSSEDFSGGSSETVKVVAADDLKKLSAETLQTNIERGQKALNEKLGLRQKLIPGSSKNQLTEEKFNAKVDDEADRLELTQTMSTTGLVYSAEELDTILDELVKGFIPDGYVISEKERDTNVEVLGNSDSTVLNPTEADLQVTLKAYVVPNVEEDKLKEDLKGKGIGEAQKILGGIRNINTYELHINPNIPLLARIPTNTENISVEIVRND